MPCWQCLVVLVSKNSRGTANKKCPTADSFLEFPLFKSSQRREEKAERSFFSLNSQRGCQWGGETMHGARGGGVWNMATWCSNSSSLRRKHGRECKLHFNSPPHTWQLPPGIIAIEIKWASLAQTHGLVGCCGVDRSIDRSVTWRGNFCHVETVWCSMQQPEQEELQENVFLSSRTIG